MYEWPSLFKSQCSHALKNAQLIIPWYISEYKLQAVYSKND